MVEADGAAVAARLRASGSVFAEDEARLLIGEAPDAGVLERMISRRESGDPLEQIVGWAEFAGLRVGVEPGVFVPRRRTELLAREAATLLHPGDTALELCCGAGAVALVLARDVPGAEVHAAELDPVAVHCARRNLAGVATVHEGDLFAALPAEFLGRFAVIAANAPYVPSDEIRLMPPEARDHEPWSTLDGGADGVEFHRRIAAEAPRWLAPGGSLLIETSERQAPLTVAAMESAGLRVRIAHDDDLDATVVIGRSVG